MNQSQESGASGDIALKYESLLTEINAYRTSLYIACIGVALFACWGWAVHQHTDWVVRDKILEILATLFLGTGGLSILIDLATKRTLMREMKTGLRDLFDFDPVFASRLSPMVRSDRVKGLLDAHLPEPEQLGSAIFSGLVERYFSKETVTLRDDAEFTVELSPCKRFEFNRYLPGSEINLQRYCHLEATYAFSGDFPHQDGVTVIGLLSDSSSDLQPLFWQKNILAREVLQFDASHRELILQRLNEEKDSGKQAEMIRAIAEVEVRLNGKTFGDCHTSLGESSLVFHFPTPPHCPIKPNIDSWTVKIRSVYLRTAGHFPIIMPCPTHKPVIRFIRSTDDFTNVSFTPFLNGTSLRSEPSDTGTSIKLTLVDEKGNPAWVFPGSGVLFTWQDNSFHSGSLPGQAAYEGTK